MKTIRIFFLVLIPLLFVACSEKIMDEINKDVNDTEIMPVSNLLPDIELRSSFETAGTDIAWYATVYIEHSTGTWGQSVDADKRISQNVSSLFNNNWSSIYSVMESCNDVIKKTDPTTGTEKDNFWARGIAEVLLAYNLSVTTDMWGDVPWTEALKGLENRKPKYDKQQDIYIAINAMLDDAIASLGYTFTTGKDAKLDYIYAGDPKKWIKAAYSLKARFALRLINKDPNGAATALTYISKGFASAADGLVFNSFEETATGENPWSQFMGDRSHISVSTTLYNYMKERNDPRIAEYFTDVDGAYAPAPAGNALQTQGGIYSVSLLSSESMTAPIPLMSYHELKFIEAEAKFRTGDATWKAALQAAVEAAFTYHGSTIGTYFADEVETRLTAGNELKEIIMQKYIAFYEYEAIEAYNDYRRTGYPTMFNPQNVTTGFVNRFPYALSETSNNGSNVPAINVFTDKVWWAK